MSEQIQKPKRTPVFWKDLMAGYISGVANICVGQPFDICKVRIQSAGGGSFPALLKQIIKEEGVFTLWKGSLFPLLCFGLANSICFAVNEHFKHFFKTRHASNELGFIDYYLSGGIAGIANSVVSSPMEHIRIRMQIQKDGVEKIYKNSIDCAKKIYRKHGLFRGIYKGYLITVYREFFLYSAYFAWYELCKKQQAEPSFIWLLISGGVGGTGGWIGGFLIDNIKSRIQTDDFKKPKFKSLLNVHRQLGVKDVVKGFTPGFIRAFPVNAVTFTVFEIACMFLYKDPL